MVDVINEVAKKVWYVLPIVGVVMSSIQGISRILPDEEKVRSQTLFLLKAVLARRVNALRNLVSAGIMNAGTVTGGPEQDPYECYISEDDSCREEEHTIHALEARFRTCKTVSTWAWAAPLLLISLSKLIANEVADAVFFLVACCSVCAQFIICWVGSRSERSLWDIQRSPRFRGAKPV